MPRNKFYMFTVSAINELYKLTPLDVIKYKVRLEGNRQCKVFKDNCDFKVWTNHNIREGQTWKVTSLETIYEYKRMQDRCYTIDLNDLISKRFTIRINKN